MNIPALPVDGHITKILHTHAELSAFDAAHVDLPFDGALDPLTRRCQLWEELIDFVAMLAEDEEFASYFHQRRNLRSGFPAGDDPAVAGIEARLYEHTFAGAAGVDVVACPRCNASDGYNSDKDACLECTYFLAGRLVASLADYPTYEWQIRPGVIKVQHGAGFETGQQIYRDLVAIAGLLNLKYGAEQDGDKFYATAAGRIDGISVEVWDYLRSDVDHVEDGTEPSNPGAPMVGLHIALGELIPMLRGEPIAYWIFQNHIASGPQISLQHCVFNAGDARNTLAALAGRLGFEYAEVPRGRYVRNEVRGTVNGVPVEIWTHSNPPVPDAGNDQNAVAEEAWQRAEAEREDQRELAAEYPDYAEAAAVREIEREMAVEAGDDSEIDHQVALDDARNERRAQAAREALAAADATHVLGSCPLCANFCTQCQSPNHTTNECEEEL